MAAARCLNVGRGEQRCRIKSIPNFWIRIGTSDLAVCRKVFDSREYSYTTTQSVRTIIDAGANIGCSAVDFARRYPEARIIAVEPDASNFALLQTNTAAYSNITVMNAALWAQDSQLVVEDTGQGKWAMRAAMPKAVSAQDLQTVRGVSLTTLKREFNLDVIDILKVDIEGGELEVFRSGTSTLDTVNVLMIECHDRWIPGTIRTVMKATAEFSYEWVQGENHFFCRESWRPTNCEAGRIARVHR